MSDTREEFEKWLAKCPNHINDIQLLHVWQAATSASDARYQLRIKELEEALQDADISLGDCPQWDSIIVKRETIEKLLSTTTPDTAYQKALLEARIDELETARDGTHLERRSELRAQLDSLNRNETLGE